MHQLRLGNGGCEPGWYLVEGLIDPPRPTALQLKVASAGGTERFIPLARVGGDGIMKSPVILPLPAESAWLVSDDGAALPRFVSLGLRRIGRLRALGQMLAGIRTPEGAVAWGEAWRALRDAASTALDAGPSAAARLLVTRYLYGLRPGLDRSFAPAWLRSGWSWTPRMVKLRPDHDLQPAGDASASDTWDATGEDPRFTLVDHGAPAAMKRGWYRLRARIAVVDGDVVAPALYPDYGRGQRHEDMIRLPDPDSDGWIDLVVLLKQDVLALRFDPTIRRARFIVHGFGLERLGRSRALLRMLAGTRPTGGGHWRSVAAASLSFARTLFTQGATVAASDLHAAQPGMRHAGGDYSAWVRRYDTLARADLENLRRRTTRIAAPPLISLIVPVYQTPERWLRRCLDSVLQQAYPHWELCIADDASPDPRVAAVLREYAARDPRIRLALRDVNGHISEASNSALRLATGEFIGLLDHDDELRPHALLEMAEAIAARAEVGLLYSDEDKIDGDGRRFQPNFKPDWNPDLLRSQNYICHFTVIRTDLVRAVGGFRKGFEGSQDHDLFLRCAERLAPEQIHHVPKILYHWRAVAGSTALERASKDYASAAGVRAVAEHLERTGTRARVEELPHGHYRVAWPLPDPLPKVSIIVPTRDRLPLLRGCIESVLERTDYGRYEIVVVDNQSVEPDTLEYLRRLQAREGVRVLRYDAPFNYAAINNWAAARCDGELLALLNNDIEVDSPGWLAEMAGHALRPEIGAVGGMLYYPDRTIQHAGVILGIDGVANHAFLHQPAGSPGYCARALVAQNLSAVTGACLVVRREAFERVGGLDEALAVAFNDIDFCLRLRDAGYRNVWTPFAELYHHESASRGSEDTAEKKRRFAEEVELMQRRWGRALLCDPAYNPNLSLRDAGFDFAFPPRACGDATPA